MRLHDLVAERAQAAEILRPVRGAYIAGTLLVALLLNLLALPGFLQTLRPDFIGLTLIYWVVYHPRRVGFLPAWVLGLAMDVADGSLFGQHALAYAGLMYLAILAASQAVMLLVRLTAGSDFPGPLYFAPSIVGAILWPAMFNLIRLPLRPRADPDAV